MLVSVDYRWGLWLPPEIQAKERFWGRHKDESTVENLPQQKGKTRDALASELGISGKTYEANRGRFFTFL